jgi:DNA sulfur modification protein DndB
MDKADFRFGYSFPAIRGIQAGREYYTSMCPLRIISKLFLFDEAEAELPAELRAQRTLNRARIPEITNYILRNRDNYVFSALTASIDAEIRFDPLATDGAESLVGLLRIPMGARFIVNDGQHRRAAIEEAVKQNPSIGDESISVVFFIDQGLERCQQMFADLNRHGVRPNKSIGVLYEHREDMAKLTRLVILKSEFFKDLVEMERSSLSPRSRKLFTLSALYFGTRALLDGLESNGIEADLRMVVAFWEAVAKQIPEWDLVRKGKLSSGEVRRDFVHSHGITLHALGEVGNCLMKQKNGKPDWQARLSKLKTIDWTRSNAATWEGRVLIGGHVTKVAQNVVLMTNLIKQTLKLPLTPEEERAEKAYKSSSKKQRAA